jgi:hypothetical protein
MNEAAWLAFANPTPMLAFLRGKASDRKLRLFAIACCCRIWQRIGDPRSQAAVEFADQHADEGLARRRGVGVVRKDARAAYRKAWDRCRVEGNAESHYRLMAAHAVEGLLTRRPWETVPFNAAHATTDRSQGWQSDLLRDIIGNPFRPSPPLPPAVLAWNDGTIPRLAQAIYEERRMPEGTFDTARLAILADALLDAGCEDDELIRHCRSEGPHVRGCWAVDLILGKS